MNLPRKVNVDRLKSQAQKGILRIPLWKLKVHLIFQKVLNRRSDTQESPSVPSKGWQQGQALHVAALGVPSNQT